MYLGRLAYCLWLGIWVVSIRLRQGHIIMTFNIIGRKNMPYKPYWKSEFQNCLTSLTGTRSLLRWEEISDSLNTDKHRVWEYVYRFRLKNPAVSIVIFSSVYKETDRSRDISSDAVRIVFEWHTKNGDLYSKVAKKYRVDSLFENLVKELIAASEDCFDLKKYSWVPSLGETDA